MLMRRYLTLLPLLFRPQPFATFPWRFHVDEYNLRCNLTIHNFPKAAEFQSVAYNGIKEAGLYYKPF